MVETAAKPDTGQMLVPVEAGMNRVQITFVRTWDRAAGGWISLITVILLIDQASTNETFHDVRHQTLDLGQPGSEASRSEVQRSEI